MKKIYRLLVLLMGLIIFLAVYMLNKQENYSLLQSDAVGLNDENKFARSSETPVIALTGSVY